MAGTGGANFDGRSEERKDYERFVDALRLWMGKRPLYKPDRNEACLDWFHRTVDDGNRRIPSHSVSAR